VGARVFDRVERGNGEKQGTRSPPKDPGTSVVVLIVGSRPDRARSSRTWLGLAKDAVGRRYPRYE
jgi:hypothetical protein